ncbi:hypothetical protein V6Z11_A10G273600 [Gossypium hirsutum]
MRKQRAKRELMADLWKGHYTLSFRLLCFWTYRGTVCS